MSKIKDLEETYNECSADGNINFKEETDIDLIKSLLDSAKRSQLKIKKDRNIYEKETKDWTFTFRDNYEILRTLIDAFLGFDKVSINNHQCSNAYLCTKHKLDFDWEILESMRLIRNGINYQGKTVSQDKWNEFRLKFQIYISTLINEIEKRMKEVD